MENTLNVVTENGNILPTQIISRSLCGNIALHYTHDGNKRKGEGNTYTLTHVGTLNAICTGIMRREDAERLMDTLATKYDWNIRSRWSLKVWQRGSDSAFLNLVNSVRRFGGKRTAGHSMSVYTWRKLALSDSIRGL